MRRLAQWGLAGATCLALGTVGLAQVGRGGSRWFAPHADAQRTSWVRADQRISPEAMRAPGFRVQWKIAPGRAAGASGGFAHGVTASGVTLFVPMSVVTGAGDRVYGLDNDIGFVVWQRGLDLEDAASLPACAGAITAATTRIVPLDASATRDPLARPPSPPGVGYRTLLGRPGEGNPVDNVRRQQLAAARAAAPPPSAAPAAPATPAPGASSTTAAAPGAATSGAVQARSPDDIPGAPPFGGPSMRALARPSGVAYVIARDGRLRVLGLASGKDLQRPARFLPRGARWTAPIAVGTTLYAATTGNCGGTTEGVWALDLDSQQKPVTSWLTRGGPIAGPVAFTSSGTLLVAVGAGQATGDGKASAIVALDPTTLAVKDWFTRPDADFATGPSVFRSGDREIVTAATRDGRVLLLDAANLGGADHATPLATSAPVAAAGSVRRDALAVWQRPDRGETWVLVPVDGRIGVDTRAGGPRTTPPARGGIVALQVRAEGGALALTPAWTSDDLATPATPLIVNGVVFALSPGGAGRSATLHAYDGISGRRLWTSGGTMTAAASPGSLWSGLGQVYVGTEDGTLYAFGFDDERHAIRSVVADR